MRRELKPTLRQDTFKKPIIVVPPDEEEYEIVLNVGTDTTLHYKGSPLMDPNLVADPNGETVIPGEDSNYKDEPWIAIGLATDNVTNASDNLNNEGNPAIGSGGNYQPPDGSQASGVVYTQIGPSRGALFFDLGFLPVDAEILEATLELEPYDVSGGAPTDPFGEGVVDNIWPSVVNCEVLNLPVDADENATWNTRSGRTITVTDSPFTFTVPLAEDRWWRTQNSLLLPNAIGMAQNTRRSDIGEPVETFVGQGIISSDVLHQFDGPDGDTTAEEYFGHIGYGISGGGSIVNYIPATPDLGHATFEITNEQHLAIINPQTGGVNTISVDVKNEIEYAIANGRKGNLLIRASHWDTNTAAQTPDDQLTYEDAPVIEPLQFTSAHLSDTENGAVIDTIVNSGTLHAVTDIANADSVVYEWLIEIPVSPFEFLDFGIIGNFQEGQTVEITNVAYNGGDPATDIVAYQWIQDGVDISGATSTTFTIPDGFGGTDLRARVTVSNPTNGLTPISKTSDAETVSFDGVGSFDLVKVSPTGTNVTELQTATAQVTNVSGVANPRFDYHWYKSQFSDGSNNIGDVSQTLNTSSLSNTATAPEGDYSGGISNFLVCQVTMYENTIPIHTQVVSWTLADVIPPELPAQRNGVYKVDNVAVFRNCSASSNLTDLNPYEYSVLEGCSYTVLEQPSQISSCGPESGQYGTPFGWWADTSGNLNPVTTSNLNRYWPFSTAQGGMGLIGFAARGDGNVSGAKSRTTSQSTSNACGGSGIHMVTRNGFNGTELDVATAGGKKPGDVAVWIPEFSDTNGWIIMSPRFAGPVFRSNGTRVGGGGGLVDNGGESPTFASNYGSHNGSRCVFQNNNDIAWLRKSNLNNSAAATTFLQTTLQPTPIITADDQNRNPINDTDGKLNNVYLVFFDKELTDTEANDFISTPITNFDPSYGGGGGGEEPGTIPLINELVNTADHVITFQPNEEPTVYGDGNSTTGWVNEGYSETALTIDNVHGNLTIADRNNDKVFIRFFNSYLTLRIEPILNDGSISAGNTQSYYNTNSDTGDWTDGTGPEIALFTYKKIDGVNWSLVGYITGNTMTDPAFTQNYPDHMYRDVGNAISSEYMASDLAHVLYVYDTRANFESLFPSSWQDISAWDTSGFLTLPV